jgi:hypothetical protein
MKPVDRVPEYIRSAHLRANPLKRSSGIGIANSASLLPMKTRGPSAKRSLPFEQAGSAHLYGRRLLYLKYFLNKLWSAEQ